MAGESHHGERVIQGES